MKIFHFIAHFTESLNQLNAWGIDTNELTYLTDQYGALTNVIEGTHDSIELVFRNINTGGQITICASMDKMDGSRIIGYIPVNNI